MTTAVEKVKKIYQQAYKKFGVSHKSLLWTTKGAAHQRFRQMWAEIDFSGKSILDVGCGFAEMAKFLDKRYKNFSYTGVDVVPQFIKEAKKQFPHHRFFVRDYFKNPLKERFDVIISSGTLNSNIVDNMAYRKSAIKTMFTHTKKLLAFNMLGGYPQPANDSRSNLWYADMLEVLEYCLELTRRVILRHHYHPEDFTILMYRLFGTKKFGFSRL